MEITPLFSAMDVSATGLAAQRKRMNAIAENIANVETTHTTEGGPYRRQQAVLRKLRAACKLPVVQPHDHRGNIGQVHN